MRQELEHCQLGSVSEREREEEQQEHRAFYRIPISRKKRETAITGTECGLFSFSIFLNLFGERDLEISCLRIYLPNANSNHQWAMLKSGAEKSNCVSDVDNRSSNN